MATYQDNFFTRGPSPLARVTFFSLLAIVVMIADHRFQALNVVRSGVATALHPVEQALMWPGQTLDRVGDHFRSQSTLVAENRALQEKLLQQSAESQRARLIASEQAHVTTLNAAQTRFQREGLVAEIIRDARNPFSRRIIINRGLTHGIKAGAVVMDGEGVVGQVTTLGANSAEVTLITEKDQSVPVMALRNSLRAVAVGNGRDGMIELPFLAVAADLQVGDQLVTSGIDGTYPAGLAVATITVVDKNPAFSFSRIVAKPASAPNHHRFVKVLLSPLANPPGIEAAYPAPDVEASAVNDKAGSKREAKLDAKRALRDRANERPAESTAARAR